jgi:hypothetical protein
MQSDLAATPHASNQEDKERNNPSRENAAICGLLGLFAALLPLVTCKHAMYVD